MSDAAHRVGVSRAVTSALLLVMTTLVALLVSIAVSFIRLDVRDVLLRDLQRIALPIGGAALMVLIGTLLGALIATATFRVQAEPAPSR